MDEISFISSKSNLWKKGGGILVTLITLAIIEIAAWTWIRIPNPPPVLLLAVVFSTFVGGLRQGLISAVITWLYTFYHFSIPGQLFHYTDESFLRIIVLTGVIPAMAILVGILKRRAERTDEISRLNVRIQAELAEHQKAEETLRQSEEKFRQFAENISEVFWMTDPNKNQMIYISPAYESIWGRSCAGLYTSAQNWADAIHPEDRPRVWEAATTKQASGEYDEIYRIVRPDGSVRWIHDRAFPVKDQAGQVYRIAGIAEDITERKRVETERQESEQQLRLFVEHSPAAIAMFNRDMKYLVASRRWLSDYGLGDQQIIGRSHYDVFPGLPERWKTIHQRCLAGAVESCEEDPFPRTDGHTDWVRWDIRPWRRADGQIGGIIIFSEVITERKLIEGELRESEKKYRTLITQSPDGIFIVDLQGTFLAVNKAMCERLKYSEEEFLSMKIWDIVPEKYMDLHKKRLADILRGEGSNEAAEYVVKGKDEKIHYIEVLSNPYFRENEVIGFQGIARDITERKRVEEEIRIANEELLAINRIITTTTTTATTTEVKGILEKVLDEALHITGLEGGTICMVTPDETLDLAVHRETSEATILDLTTNQIKVGECLCGECARSHKPLILWDREAVLKFSTREAQRGEDIRFHAAFPLITGKRCMGVLCVFTRTDKKPAERSLKLLETVTSQIAIALENARLYEETVNHAAIMEDRVKERTAELNESQRALMNLVEDLNIKSFEIEKANLRLQELDRLKSMFIASMSHELRTPLNSIIGFTGILLQGMAGELNDEQQDQLQRVQASGKHLLELINDVIDISKIEAGKLQTYVSEFSLATVIDQAVAALKGEIAHKGLDLEIALPDDVTLNTDRRRLLQCVLNLLGNAVKYTEKGVVRLSARLMGGERLKSSIEISVADTGIGIREEDLPLLFAPFTRLESPLKVKNPGTGLGLYLTQKIAVELLGGAVVAQSKPGVGSTFTLIIPKTLSGGEIK